MMAPMVLIVALLLTGVQTGASSRAPPASVVPARRGWQLNTSLLHTADVLARARLAAASAGRVGLAVNPDELAYISVHGIAVNWTALALTARQLAQPPARTGVTCSVTSGNLVPGATGIVVSVSGTPGATPSSPRTFLLSIPTTVATAGPLPTLLAHSMAACNTPPTS